MNKTTLSENVKYSAALYVRLSKEDEEKKRESDSITNQKAILKEYVKRHPEISIYDYYVDDGCTGTDFERSGFLRMASDIRSGKVNCVIVKDLSRFGRNYTEAGYYVDDVFLDYDVRFISVNNAIDTKAGNSNAFTHCINMGVTNVINESYAAMTSVNIKATLDTRRGNGEFIGSFPTYGYIKDPDDRHRLMIDEEAAQIVRMVFERYLAGMSIIGITKELNELKIPNPSTYKSLKPGSKYSHPTKSISDGLWSESSVRRILQNEMYIGNMVQGKNKKKSYKSKKCISVPKDEWIVVENTHEPIIDKDTFYSVQSLFNKNIRKSPKKNEVELFAGLVRCADCHRIMSKKSNRHPYGEYHYYRCTTARKMKKSICTNHTIRIDKIYQAVLVTIQHMIAVAVEYDELIKRINEHPERKSRSDRLERAINMSLEDYEKHRNLMRDLYPDMKLGRITEEEYELYRKDFSEKLRNIEESIKKLRKNLEEMDSGMSENLFVTSFRKMGNIDNLTRPLLTELIEEILVHEGGGITIRFKCSDAYEQVYEYIEMNKNIVKTA